MGEQRRPAIAMVNDHDPSVATIFPRKGDTASGRRHNLRQRLRQNSEPACAHPAFRKFAKASHHFADNGETIGRRTTMGLNRFSIRRRSLAGAWRPQHRAGKLGQFLAHIRSEEHTSELQSLMPNAYAVFWLKK